MKASPKLRRMSKAVQAGLATAHPIEKDQQVDPTMARPVLTLGTVKYGGLHQEQKCTFLPQHQD
jgi:hypothetical protein